MNEKNIPLDLAFDSGGTQGPSDGQLQNSMAIMHGQYEGFKSQLAEGLDEPKEHAGIVMGALHSFWKNNIIGSAVNLAYDSLTQEEDDIPPLDWTAMKPESIAGFPEQFDEYITGATSPLNLKYRQDKVREQIENDDYYDNGHYITNAIAGIGGAVATPNWLNLLNIVRAGNVTTTMNILSTAVKSTPILFADNVLREGIIQADRVDGSLQETLTNSLIGTAFGGALLSAGLKWHTVKSNVELKASQKIAEAVGSDLKTSFILDDHGNPSGIHVSVFGHDTASAARVVEAQRKVDDMLAQPALYKLPGVKKLVDGLYAAPGVKNVLNVLSSPAIKAQRSNYDGVRDFYTKIFGNPFYTRGNVGEGGEASASEFTAVELEHHYTSQAINLVRDTNKALQEANGFDRRSMKDIELSGNDAAKTGKVSMEELTREIRMVREKQGYTSYLPQANQLAEKYGELFNFYNQAMHTHTGTPLFSGPRNAANYMPNDWHRDRINANPREYDDFIVGVLKAKHELILEKTAPIFNTEKEIERLKTELKASADDATKEGLELELIKAKRNNLAERKKLHNELVDNEELSYLLDKENPLNSQERKQLKAILKPLRKARRVIKELKDEIKIREGSTKESHIEQLPKYKQELQEAEAEYKRINEGIQYRALAGEIDKKFIRRYSREEGQYKFHNPNLMLKPNRVIQFGESSARLDDAGMIDVARKYLASALRERITGNTPQDLVDYFIGRSDSTSSPITNTYKRTFMVPASEITKGGWFNPDITKTVMQYAQSVSKHIALSQAMGGESKYLSFEEYAKNVLKEHEQRIEKMYDTYKDDAKRQKKTFKANQDFEEQMLFMKDTYNTYMNKYNAGISSKAVIASHVARNVANSIFMGGVSVYQISEFANIAAKLGLRTLIGDSMLPMLRSFDFRATKHGKEFREALMDLGIANNHMIRDGSMKMQNQVAMGGVDLTPMLSKIVGSANQMSNISSRVFLTAYIANHLERLTAHAIQSKLMRTAFSVKAGKASKNDLDDFRRMGIDITPGMAERIIGAYKSGGGFKENGGYWSNFYNWNDAELVTHIGMTIKRGVKDTIINADKGASPYWTQRPLIGIITMYHGWLYNFWNRIPLNLLQRPNADKIIGTGLLMAGAYIVDPIKRVSNGKSAFDEDNPDSNLDKAVKILEYSGFGGPPWEVISTINKMMSGAIFEEKAEKRHSYKGIGAFMGPVLNGLYDAIDLTGKAVKGNMVERDYKRAAHLLPLVNSIYTRRYINDKIESLDIRKTRPREEKTNT